MASHDTPPAYVPDELTARYGAEAAARVRASRPSDPSEPHHGPPDAAPPRSGRGSAPPRWTRRQQLAVAAIVAALIFLLPSWWLGLAALIAAAVVIWRAFGRGGSAPAQPPLPRDSRWPPAGPPS